MMHFLAVCLDKPNSLDLRLINRAAHLDFLRTRADRIKVCGPMLADDGETMIGSMLIVEARDRGAAEAVLADDPYRRAGLFESVLLRQWRWVVGAPGR